MSGLRHSHSISPKQELTTALIHGSGPLPQLAGTTGDIGSVSRSKYDSASHEGLPRRALHHRERSAHAHGPRGYAPG